MLVASCGGPGATRVAVGPAVASSVDPVVTAPTTFLRDIAQLSVGSAHVCAVTTSHAVVCWGDNATGELGVGTDGLYVGESLSRPHVVGGLPEVKAVAAGKLHTCALDLAGHVYCWGSAGGDLKESEGGAVGSIELHGKRLGTPVQMPLGTEANVIALSHTTDAACAASVDGVRCWRTFQAIPIKRPRTLPAAMQVEHALVFGVSAMAMSHGKVCAVAGAKLWCWGHADAPSPAIWANGDAFTPAHIAMGEQYACATSASGDVRCWASLIDDFWKNPPDRDVQWPGKSPTHALAIGDSPICTADAIGRVDCFLSEEGGLTDDAVAASWATSGLGPHPIAGIEDAIDLGLGVGRNVMGYGFGCAMRARPDRAGALVLCWGDNESGQLGNGTTTRARAAVRVLDATR
jgi:hypothetical protein